MIAAIYARKSTEQIGMADHQKSVARQIEHARAYATSKGWVVSEDHIFVDDGISGAEFERRPAFLRLMNALNPGLRFRRWSCRRSRGSAVKRSRRHMRSSS